MAIPHSIRAKFQGLTKKLVIIAIFLLLILVTAQTPKAQAAVFNSQDKALSFLKDVLHLDMTKYTATLTEHTQSSSGEEHLAYQLMENTSNLGILNNFFSQSKVYAGFSFYNGSLGSCNLNPMLGHLVYTEPDTDPFNVTLRTMESYQKWTNDSQVQEMVNLLNNVGSIRNASLASGNLTLRISAYGYTNYKFSNTFNGVDYTGVILTFFSFGDVMFDDSRIYQTIGDTSINISKDQAINLAENYVRNYSYTTTFPNGTKITVSNLNVTGVGSVTLGTHTYNPNDKITSESSTLSPYWHIEVEVSNMTAPGLAGVEVQVSANNGIVVSPILAAKGDFSQLWNAMFPPIYSGLMFLLIIIIIFSVFLAVLLLFVMKGEKQETRQLNA